MVYTSLYINQTFYISKQKSEKVGNVFTFLVEEIQLIDMKTIYGKNLV